MRKLALLLFLIVPFVAKAQEQDTTYWRKGFAANAAFSQLSLTNWASGGQNSVALNSQLTLFADYEKDRTSWKNLIDLAYGFIQQKDDGYRKSDDKIQVSSEFGYLISRRPSLVKWTTLIDFKTQFDHGYNYPNDSVKISDFMAPGYLTVVTGIKYSPRPFFTVLYSPLSGKLTFVNDDILANAGAFGVEPAVRDANGAIIRDGKKLNSEFGTYLRVIFEKEIFKNGQLFSRAEFFTDYLMDFGIIDVNWESKLDMKINGWLSASLILHLIYDRDIRFEVTDSNGVVTGTEDRVQFKQYLGIGFKYALSNRDS